MIITIYNLQKSHPNLPSRNTIISHLQKHSLLVTDEEGRKGIDSSNVTRFLELMSVDNTGINSDEEVDTEEKSDVNVSTQDVTRNLELTIQKKEEKKTLLSQAETRKRVFSAPDPLSTAIVLLRERREALGHRATVRGTPSQIHQQLISFERAVYEEIVFQNDLLEEAHRNCVILFYKMKLIGKEELEDYKKGFNSIEL